MEKYNFLSSSDSDDNENNNIISVNKLTNIITSSLKKNLKYYYFIKGEIVIGNNKNLIASKSGHFYFNIKDTKFDITLDCMLWKTTYQNNKLKYICNNIKNGDIVKLKIHVDHWRTKNKISIVVSDIEKKDDIGSFFNKKEILFKKYKKLGYFDSNKKKIINLESLENIGLITAFGREAMSDFLKTLKNRNFNGNVFIKPCIVQGKKCSVDICNTINEFNMDNKVDIIVITRGGGSVFDLWEFNDEKIIQKIYESKLPVVCGIGHEKDDTLCDHICDISASTPTAIANYITIDRNNYNNNLKNYKDSLYNIINQKFDKQVNKLNNIINKFNNLSNIFINKLEYNENYLINKVKNDINYELEKDKVKNIIHKKTLIDNINKFKKLNDKIIQIELNDGIVECSVSSIKILKVKDNENKKRMIKLEKFIENIKISNSDYELKIYENLNYYTFINNYDIYQLDIKDKIKFILSEINKKKNHIKNINNDLNGIFKLKKNFKIYEKYIEIFSNSITTFNKYQQLLDTYKIIISMKKHLFYLNSFIKSSYIDKKNIPGKIKIITNFISNLELNNDIINVHLLNQYKKCIRILNYNIKLFEKSNIRIYKNNIDITKSIKI